MSESLIFPRPHGALARLNRAKRLMRYALPSVDRRLLALAPHQSEAARDVVAFLRAKRPGQTRLADALAQAIAPEAR